MYGYLICRSFTNCCDRNIQYNPYQLIHYVWYVTLFNFVWWDSGCKITIIMKNYHLFQVLRFQSTWVTSSTLNRSYTCQRIIDYKNTRFKNFENKTTKPPIHKMFWAERNNRMLYLHGVVLTLFTQTISSNILKQNCNNI